MLALVEKCGRALVFGAGIDLWRFDAVSRVVYRQHITPTSGGNVADIINRKTQLEPIGKLKPHPSNPRLGNVAEVLRSIEVNGFFGAIVAQESTGYVLAGNHRLLAAKEAGLSEIPVVWVDVDDERAMRILLADNRTSDLATYDNDTLAELLEHLASTDLGLDGTGYTELDLGSLLGDELHDGNTDPDEIPEPPVEPITQPGDLWILGDHRLLCGDSTSAEDVERLMDGERAVACITDPPYSVKYDQSHSHRGGNVAVHSAYQEADDDPTKLLGFIDLIKSDVLIWSYPIDRHFQAIASAYSKFGWTMKKEIIWVKDVFSFWPSAKYQQKHESIMIAVRDGKPIGGDVPANATTVLEYPKPRSHDLHPTAKPIDLWSVLVKHHAMKGELIYEPFSGSGTTMIAAEQLGRRCYGMELSPQYCDVIVKRWEDFTGKKAERIPAGGE